MKEYDLLIHKFHEHFTSDGNACITLGVNKHLDDLPDPSLENIVETVEKGKKLLAELRSFPRGVLDFYQMLDLDLAILEVEFEI